MPSKITTLSLSHSPVRHRADALHTLSERLLDLLDEHAPEDASVEDAMERLVFLAKIERGLADAEAQRTLSHADVKKRLGL